MSEEEDRLARPASFQARDKIALARGRRENVNVCVRKASGAQPRGHGLGRLCSVAGRRHRVDLDELLVDVEGALLVGVQTLDRDGCGRCQGERHHGQRTQRHQAISET